MTKVLRIFISSPGDVVPERRRAALVIEKLAKDYSRYCEIQPYLWESEPMLASGHFQDAIVPPGESDVLLLILWSRLGTFLPEQTETRAYRGIDGRAPVTGTEWEFEAALSAHRQKGTPDLIVYRKAAPPLAEYRSDHDLEELRAQFHRLDAFWRRHFVNHGVFCAAFSEFSDLAGFEARLESDLRAVIERRIAALARDTGETAPVIWSGGSPFRGLQTYEFHHAQIFFGRSEATKVAVEHLLQNAENGSSFLLVLGASGAGKSSLAQAGIVPTLAVRGVAPGVGLWRRATMRPGGHAGGPFLALAAALIEQDALPEILQGQKLADFAAHLEVAAANPSFPIVAALNAREEAARRNGDLLSFEQARLIVVVDQLEELFTLSELTAERRNAFIACLKGLIRSGRVFVVATMRSDYWHRASEVPELIELARGNGRLDLLPPTQAEITEMIRRPADVARLSFEIDPRSEIKLDAVLAEEAAREPGALPLLSFLLDALYEQDVTHGRGSVLRFASMTGLGGLKGAIATKAEAAHGELTEAAQAALPNILRSLVTLSRSGDEPTARPVAMARFGKDSPSQQLIKSFLDARLLVADGDGGGARIRLAHEALITHWDRAKRQILADRDDLRTLAAVEEAEREWRMAAPRHKSGYLLRDPQLANASDLVSRWPEQFQEDTRTFVQLSRNRARTVQRLIAAMAAVFAIVAVSASILGLMAYRSSQVAAKATEEAERNLARADNERNRALISQSRFLAQEATANLDGDATKAELLAIEALSADDTGAARPITAEAVAALQMATERPRELVLLQAHSGAIYDAEFSPDGTLLVTASADNTARIWETGTGKEVRVLRGHKAKVLGASFSADGRRIMTRSEDETVKVWDQASGAVLRTLEHPDIKIVAATFVGAAGIITVSGDGAVRRWDPTPATPVLLRQSTGRGSGAIISGDGSQIVLTNLTGRIVDVGDTRSDGFTPLLIGHTSAIIGGAFSPDGKRVVTGSGDGTARVWDSKSGKLIFVLDEGHSDPVSDARFSADGRLIVTASHTTIRIWSSQTGNLIRTIRGHADYVLSVGFSPDGKLIASSSEDGTVRIWKASYVIKDIKIDGHRKPVLGVAFNSDGTRLATASGDGSARIWKSVSGALERKFEESRGRIHSVAFSHDGDRIVTASDIGTAKIWDVATGALLVTLEGHRGRVFNAEFSADDARVITASGDGTARIWDASTGQVMAELEANHPADGPSGEVFRIGFTSEVYRAVFTPDGSKAITGSEDGKLRLWDIAKKEIAAEFADEGGPIFGIAINPDASLIATASGSAARIRRASTGEVLHVLEGHSSTVLAISFNSDATRIVTGSWDGTARLWDVQSGKEIATSQRHTAAVFGVAFNPNDLQIATSSRDSTVRLFDVAAFAAPAGTGPSATKLASQNPVDGVPAAEMVARSKASVARCLTQDERKEFFLEPAPPSWCIANGKWPYAGPIRTEATR